MLFVIKTLEKFLHTLSFRGVERLSHFLAWLLYSLLGLRRRTIRKNLDIAFGDTISPARKAEIGFQSIKSFLRTVLELIGGSKFYPLVRLEMIHEERLQAAFAKGRGVYGVGIHQGNWEFLVHVGKRFARVNMALKPVGGKKTAEWLRNRRAQFGVHEVPRKSEKPAWKLITEAMQRGEMVGVVVDQRRRKGVVSPLFGRPAWTNASLFRLWKTHPAPIFPVTIRRTGDDSHQVYVWEELEVLDSPEWSESEFLEKNVRRMNEVIEKMILWNPDEYFWMHDRWKAYPAKTSD